MSLDGIRRLGSEYSQPGQCLGGKGSGRTVLLVCVTLVVLLGACSGDGNSQMKPDTPNSSTGTPEPGPDSSDIDEDVASKAPSVAADLPDPLEYATKMGRCMEEDGWDVSIEATGYEVKLLKGQEEAYFESAEKCRDLHGFPSEGPTITEEMAGDLYDELLEVAECVTGRGIEVEDPPSRATFVETLMDHPLPIWHPYEIAFQDTQLDEVQRWCPVSIDW